MNEGAEYAQAPVSVGKIASDGKLSQDKEERGPLVMAVAQQTVAPAAAAPKQIGEWFWRFLAAVMLATIAWILWVMYQINPQPLITNAAFEAAASARASQAAKGVIAPAPADGSAPVAAAAPGQADPAKAAEPAPAEAKAPPPEPKAPPVNVERLKLSDSIETPIPERGKKK